ncbi:histidine phosphatase superfamily [Dipodascopsis tothii]|uniref:histidine phosphatase superfamily n=1 Tax=Dipodascopsis tothii TaxID=44089 RepID=UPI0034CFBE36
MANNSAYDPLLHDGQPARASMDTSATATTNGSTVDIEAAAGAETAAGAEAAAANLAAQDTPATVKYRRRRSGNTEPALKKLIILLIVPAVILLLIFFFISSVSKSPSRDASPVAAPTGISFASGFNMKQSWGSLSPYYETGAQWKGIAENAGKGYFGLPHDQCRFEQVHILHRHAERYPTGGAVGKLQRFIHKIRNMTQPAADELKWLTQWNFTLGEELLVANGVATEFASGSQFWSTHGRLLYNATAKGEMFYHPSLNVWPDGSPRPKPVLRTTDQSRIQTSAKAWAAGFFGVYSGEDDAPADDAELYKMVYMEEAPLVNNTLASYYSCPNSNSKAFTTGSKIYREWVNIFLVDAANRLNKLLPTAELTPMDVYSMMALCAYETAGYGYSRFCELFTEREWYGYEYRDALEFWGDSSLGSAVGVAQGAGYVKEVLARLEHRQLTEAYAAINTTITSSPEDFPMDQPFYLDMSHDSIIIAVLTALGLPMGQLPSDHMLQPRFFVTSRLVPFGSRLYTELISCPEFAETQVRLKLNNRVLPLSGIGECPASPDGFCPLSTFIAGLQKATDALDYDNVCFGVPVGWEDAVPFVPDDD